jgi:PAS domain S-box-containing protein
MWETISAGKTWHGVFQNKRKDGAVYAEKASIAPVLDEKNAIVNYVKVAEDISRELAMEQELRGERDLLKAIADASPVAIIMVDAAGHIVFADKQAEELFGLDREEIVSRTYNAASWRISDPNGEPMSEEELPVSRVLRSGKSVFDVRLAIERPDGERIYLSVNSCPMLNEQGEVTGVVSAAQDITRRLDDELRLRFLSSIVESAEEGIIGKDLTGVVKSWNAGAERIYGYTAEEARGRNIAMLVPEDRRDEFADYMARVKAGEAVEHLETERLTKSRERIRVALSLSPIRDGQDRIIGVSTFVRTIEPHRTGPNPS